jgi:hypothetical protein
MGDEYADGPIGVSVLWGFCSASPSAPPCRRGVVAWGGRGQVVGVSRPPALCQVLHVEEHGILLGPQLFYGRPDLWDLRKRGGEVPLQGEQ